MDNRDKLLFIVPANEYKRLLDQAKMELATMKAHHSDLSQQLGDLEKRIAMQRDGINGLALLCDQSGTIELPPDKRPLASVGFSEAVRFVLRTCRAQQLTPVEVRNKLEYWGYDLTKYRSEFLASLHKVLQRLEHSGEIKPIKASTGKTVAYQWITEMEKTLPTDDFKPRYGLPDPLNKRGKSK
ncbi:MAG: hypothetical protein WAN60_09560 [Candidatus Sulfotelmatobacter sp.]